MSGGGTGNREMHRTSGVSAGHHSPACSLDGGKFTGTNVAGQFGLQRRVGTPSAAAEPVVIKFHHISDGSHEGSDRCVRSLDVTEMAWVLHDDGPGSMNGRKPIEVRCTNSFTSTTRALNA